MQQKSHFLIRISLRFLIAGVFFLSQGFLSNAQAQGDLLITPKRVVFEGQKRSQEITLANIGNDTARYSVSFIQIRMKADGGFEQITAPDAGQNFSDKNLRIFPRQVTLAPKESQVVKIQTSQTSNLSPGEYRSHLYFRALPKQAPLADTTSGMDNKSVAVRLTPIFGISIPIIIRVGESDTKVSLTDLRVEAVAGQAPVLKLQFNRSGNMSIYGDLTVEHISAEGRITQAAIIKGISVYTPNNVRNLEVKLDNRPGIDYKKGVLRVVYASPAEGKPEKFASAEMTLK
jgi:P pilus assembly chaperone PapD